MPITRREFLKGASSALALNTPLFEASAKESSATLEERANTWEPEILNFINQNKGHVIKSAVEYDLPPVLLAAVLYHEKTKDNSFARARDYLASTDLLLLMGFKPTLGDGQVKISSAALVDGKDYSRLNIDELRNYRRKLAETSSNIGYAAKYLKILINRPNRFPNISSEELLNNPNAMAIAATEYNIGPRKSTREQAKPNASGFYVVSLLTDDSPLYKIFGREYKKEGQKIREYIKNNQELLREALTNRSDEAYMRKSRDLGYSLLGLTALGGLYYFLKLIERKNKIR